MVNNGFIKKLWNWFDEYFLLSAVAFLIAFIPLYPKIPIADIIPGYIVRIRLEDLFIAVFGVWWGIQVLRQKVHWKTPLTLFVLAYAISGFLSNILGVYLTHTIPAELLHVGKSMLHWMRYLQYFSLFFLAYSAVKTRRHGQWLVFIMVLTLLAVTFYGYGQKNWFWPVYSTMNREFSKGIRLYLGEHARVQSTFAGHYDLGAYLVVLVPLVWSLSFAYRDRGIELAKKGIAFWRRWTWWWSLLMVFTLVCGLWLLVLSASRTSFLGYAVAVILVTGWYWIRQKRGFVWFVSRSFAIGVVSTVFLLTIGDLSTRFAQLIDEEKYPELHAAYTEFNRVVDNPEKLLGMNWIKSGPPAGSKSVSDLEKELNEQGLTVSDTQPTSDKPSDVTTSVPEQQYELNDPAATLAGELVQVGDKLVKERVYSDCALTRSLSLCIRLETLWPQAINGFTSNPLFGSGYATLTKSTVEQFTEAESTDNNFLRTLGETGALGFFFFYGAVGIALWYHFRAILASKDNWLFAVAVGGFAGTVGLLINALYIDVFAASKVAYTFWTVQGVLLALYVREGVAGERFAYDRHATQKQTAQLSALLAQVESESKQRFGSGKYVSQAKRRAKSTRKKKSVSRK